MDDADKKDTYHHGNLRSDLITAAEAELEQNGIEAFSLRSVSKRAGVSHAAPAHHFGDTKGLLTALAAEGYRRLARFQSERCRSLPDQSSGQIVELGLGYIAFAVRHKALFRLMTASDRLDRDDKDLAQASFAALDDLMASSSAASGQPAWDNADALLNALSIWSLVHGLADHLTSGRLDLVQQLPTSRREAVLRKIIGGVAGVSN